MSDTPRTDEREARNGNVLCGSANLDFARQLERELTEAQHRIRTLIEERDTARLQADQKWKLREEFEALLGTDSVAIGVDRIKQEKLGAARYEVVRKMNPTDFALLYQRCLHMNLRFDDEVDKIGGIK